MDGKSDIAPTPAEPDNNSDSRPQYWLIIITSASALICMLTAGLTIMLSLALPLGVGPSTSIDTYYTLQGWVCGGAVVVIALLSAGISGGWIAYRKKHTKLALILSLSPFILIILICAFLTFISGLEVVRWFS